MINNLISTELLFLFSNLAVVLETFLQYAYCWVMVIHAVKWLLIDPKISSDLFPPATERKDHSSDERI